MDAAGAGGKHSLASFASKIEGSVLVTFDVDVFGEVSNAVVKSGLGYGCDDEALRLVKMLKYEKKKYRGMYVMFHNSIYIHFHLPGKPIPMVPQQVQVVYHYKEK